MQYRFMKYACFTVNLSMSVIATLSPILFLTFRELYGITFSMLGGLVVINFMVQLGMDLLLSFYSHKFSIPKLIRSIPILTAVGLLIYTLTPLVLPNAVYAGLVVGTLIFSASSGLAEALISPLFAALPSENPEREMTKLHSIYAWGVVLVTVVSTLLLFLPGRENWQWIPVIWCLIPLASCILFTKASFPPMETPEKASAVVSLLRSKGFLLCLLAIILGGPSECIMSQWSSSYLEYTLQIPKVWGDVLGVAVFAMMLGLGRTLYAKYGKNITLMLSLCAGSSVVCYLVAALVNIPAVGLAACALCGLTTSILWPCSLSVAAERFPTGGVAMFALMAAGGDFGAALGNQVMGSVTDLVAQAPWTAALSSQWQLTAEQLGMRIGLLICTVFPALCLVVHLQLHRQGKKDHLPCA